MTFRSPEHRRKWKEMLLPEGMYWGGDCGANLVDGYLIPGEFEIYSDVDKFVASSYRCGNACPKWGNTHLQEILDRGKQTKPCPKISHLRGFNGCWRQPLP